MRHLKKGRTLGRSSSHRRALYRNMVASLFLTERETIEDLDLNAPKVKGRITTTLHKAKEIRPMVEKCITIARKGLEAEKNAESLVSSAERGSDEWKKWRKTEDGQKWNDAIAPAVNARRKVMQMIRSDEAVEILFDKIAPRFMDRPGGYTRILKLAHPRLGDNGKQAIIEFVGENDRVKKKAAKPAFDDADEKPENETVDESSTDDEITSTEEASVDADSSEGTSSEESSKE